MAAVEYVHENGVARITLNSPPQNRIGNELVAGLTAAIMDVAGRNDTRALLLSATGPDFSWGGDIRNWQNISHKDFGATLEQALQLTNTFEDFPFPTIAAVQGQCSGGGYELALRADIIIAADNARFGHSEATIGVFTFLGGVQRVADRIGRGRALEWAYTAEMIEAQRALDLGLVNQCVPSDELADTAESWVEKLASGATLAHAAHKKLLRAWSTSGVAAADAMIPQMAEDIHASADLQDHLPAAIAAVEAGEPRPKFPFKGQ
ncbi:enoyl-CoA hydratase/isomerase family protein [Alterisphingorhabdus coralli]|uniref:Enoyl-CoA hydratase/isomerase family protein n=1 Tax=Alterisphingorhabdus coralli TaxID=3071408 RepID=A0AA97F727_9SPHN|nr:enoyl-CoA hydratase/isomerase family protein [Parasphingorhabdus sp. SCSIO 66989]WOE74676.1 enoyl-CoA hydratase/isomerase family protein [Parasphingorhabdus sp. SCSIO 66989]